VEHPSAKSNQPERREPAKDRTAGHAHAESDDEARLHLIEARWSLLGK